MRRKPRCPACGAVLEIRERWRGLVKRWPRSCQACGVRLLYDSAGGVHVARHRKDSGTDEDAP